jgi:hypothetical protein
MAKTHGTRTDAFVRDMLNVLDGCCGLQFEPEHSRKGRYGCVDLVGRHANTNEDGKGSDRVFIEVELRRYGAVGNVIKIWRRLDEQQCPDDVVFIQAFSAFYKKKQTARISAEFIAQKMKSRYPGIRYIPLSFDYRPAARKSGAPVMKGAGRRKYHAEKLAKRIKRRLKPMFQTDSARTMKALAARA